MADLTGTAAVLTNNHSTGHEFAVNVTQANAAADGVLDAVDSDGQHRTLVGFGTVELVGKDGPGGLQIVNPAAGTTGPVTQLDDGLRFGPGTGVPDVSLYRFAGTLRTDGQFRADDGVKGLEVAGAGRTKAADTDFTHTPTDGMTATVRNTTNGKVYLSARSGGAWFSVQLS